MPIVFQYTYFSFHFVVWFFVASTLKGFMAIFQLHWWRTTSAAPPCIISGTSGHLSRTTEVPWARKIDSSHEKVPGGVRTHSGEGQVNSSQPIGHGHPLTYYYYNVRVANTKWTIEMEINNEINYRYPLVSKMKYGFYFSH